MNGRELSKTSLVDNPTSNAKDDTSPDDEEFKRWVSVVAGCLQTAVIVPPANLGIGAPETSQPAPEGWRQSVGPLTPTNSLLGEVATTASGGASPTTAGDSELQRIQIRVNTKEFGEVSLVVERAEQGLRIVLGAVDGRVVSALRHEALAVRRALESGGQSVGMLEIVRMNEVGTVLAQSKVAPSNRLRRLREQAEDASNPQSPKKKSRRINLIG